MGSSRLGRRVRCGMGRPRMSEAAQTPNDDNLKGWRGLMAAPAFAILAIACCLAAPLIVGVVGALSAGAIFGLAAGGIALLALCLWTARKVSGDRSC